jgi:hypothetical protein
MLDNLYLHQRFIAILLLPLVLLAAVAPAGSAPRHGGRAGRAGEHP